MNSTRLHNMAWCEVGETQDGNLGYMYINFMLFVPVILLVFDRLVHTEAVEEMVHMACRYLSAPPLNKWFKSPSPGMLVIRAV